MSDQIVEPARTPTRDLGGGVTMPMLGLGLWRVPAGAPTENAVEWALEAGYRHLDTAAAYKNEGGVGAALARSGVPREEVFVTTKWMPLTQSPTRSLERSLERLGLAQVDLFLIHWPFPGRTGRVWPELEQLQARGLTRAIGVCNYGAAGLGRLLGGATRPPAVNQVFFSPLHYRRKLLELCREHGVVLEAYSSLEHGRALGNPTVVAIAKRIGRSPAQVLLRWAIEHEVIVIPKSITRRRIRENAAIFDFSLTAGDLAALDGLDRTGGTGRALWPN